MAFKFIVALAFVAVASAGLVPATQLYHAAQPVLAKSEDANDPHPQYQFSYSVNDALTGDVKSQTETRDGDLVQGEYSLNDADGYKRTVQYSSDAVNGFNAIVNREPLGQIVKAAPVAAAPVSYAAPTLVKSAPLAYAAAPALIKSAPLAYAAAPTLVRSAPLGYSAPATYTQAYTHAAAPTLIRSSPIAYSHGPAVYTTQSLVKSSPIAYAAAPAYATGPVYAYHH
ncbi:cuticle protein-like [Eupeodes corollae]|uniref:cuticle protein-like n=1 Tax=Eupeodes corollae TaxID=290404 RepID=UPI002490331F|nr:cuticle protein-like [Eupeodes corollae]